MPHTRHRHGELGRSPAQAAVEESRHALEVEDMPEATVRLLRAKLKASESLVKELEGTAADRDKQLTEALK